MIKKTTIVMAVLCALGPVLASAGGEVNVYSARKEALIRPLLDRFESETGIKVNLLTGKEDALLKRLESEGRNSPADLLVTTDAGRLHRAKQADVLQPILSEILDRDIPPQYRDSEGYWYGLSVRARTLFYAKDRVKPEQLSTYEALTDPEWKGRICVRSSDNIYNQSLVASMIASEGDAQAQSWADGLVKNFAGPPRGGDRDQIKAAAAGQCDVAIANTYYFGAMLASKDEKERRAAELVGLFWPNQSGRGVHVNISGAGVTRAAKNREHAVRLLEFLVGDEAQFWYAETNNEYPVKPGVPWSDTLQAWGEFRSDSLNLALLGRYNPDAVRIMDRAGWK